MTSPALQECYYRYTHLSLGGKEIACPYWVNIIRLGIWGPGGGKGTPEEITNITKEEASKAGIDLNSLSERDILTFMRTKRIGVDCSGFVFWMLDALDYEKGGNGIADDIPGSQGKFTGPRANVRMLTDSGVCVDIEKIKEAKVGDIIRLMGSKHIAIVLSLDDKEIIYAHSSGKTEVTGVHLGRIEIIDSQSGLERQVWEENIPFLPGKGDGIKRLKIWA